MKMTARLARRSRPCAIVAALILATAGPAHAQFGYGGYGGFGGGYGGYGGFGGGGYGGFGGFGGYGGFVGIGNGLGYPGFAGSYGGFGYQSTLVPNNLGFGLVPPAYVGTGTAGIGPVGIGGVNPLFGLGLSPLAVHNAVAEQNLRLRYSPYSGGYYRGYAGAPTRRTSFGIATPANSYTNTTIPNAVSTVPR